MPTANENAWIAAPALNRLAEARFFLNKLAATREMLEVRFYLSAFLNAAKNLDNLMHHQFGKAAGFKEFWKAKVEEAGESHALIFRARNRNTHGRWPFKMVLEGTDPFNAANRIRLTFNTDGSIETTETLPRTITTISGDPDSAENIRIVLDGLAVDLARRAQVIRNLTFDSIQLAFDDEQEGIGHTEMVGRLKKVMADLETYLLEAVGRFGDDSLKGRIGFVV